MAARTIAPGLTRWTSFHQEWQQEVGSLLAEMPDAIAAGAERVLVSRHEPVLEGGHAALAAALGE